MADGPGKYDDIATLVRMLTNARAVLLVVVGGDQGEGFACQSDAMTAGFLPGVLEEVARELRRDMKRKGPAGEAGP